MIACIIFLFIPALLLFGYQAVLESKGINDPTLSVSLYRTTIMLDSALKLFLVLFIDDFEIYSIVCFFAILVYFFLFFVRISIFVPKISLRKNRKYPQETNYTICALKVVSLGCFSLIFNIAVLLSCWSFEEVFILFFVCSMIIAMNLFNLYAATQTFLRLDRLKYSSIRSLSGLAHNNSPIVLLRSFKIDSTPTMNGKVFDETICDNLNLEKNPVVSLANPDEILPSGGSLKIQAKDSEWKGVVKELLGNCRAVILVEGRSEGLHWEISKLREFLSPNQLFVMIPSRTYREIAWCYNDDAGSGVFSIIRNMYRFMNVIFWTGNKEKKKILDVVWKEFTEKMNQYGIHTPVDFPGDSSLVSFDTNWNGVKNERVKDVKSMFEAVVEQTASFNRTGFDYTCLGKKIESFEVNGFLDPKDVEPFKKIVKRYAKIGLIASLIFVGLFVVFVLFLFL